MTAKTPEQAKIEPENITDISFPVEGMTCASCVRRVERALEKMPGVATANVNLATERASVSSHCTIVSRCRRAALRRQRYCGR